LTAQSTADSHSPLIIARPDHNVSRSGISKAALKVLYRLKDAGHEAFLVGGGVRDLMLGLRPKDFDIATSARPEEVRALFSNSRLIGRRFRLAHVRFGREIIEVATFRGTGEGNGADDGHVLHESGRILADNAFGTIEEDALRRDFTINALYYNIADYSVWDFAEGVEDVRNRCLRLIGDPERRYREDPVRMLRAARLAAKLDLTIHPDSAAPIPAMARLIEAVPPARLFDEFLKLFQTGHALASYRKLRELGLFDYLFPPTAQALGEPDAESFEHLIEAALINTDQRVAEDRPVTPMFLFAVLLWRPVERLAAHIMAAEDCSESQAMLHAVGEALTAQAQRITLPRRFSLPMRDVLQLQPRFENRRGRRAAGLLEHRRFRAAYDLLVLRGAAGEVDPELVAFWTRVQELEGGERQQEFGGEGRRRRRRRPRNKVPAG
jgi:poly(A) polymerase